MFTARQILYLTSKLPYEKEPLRGAFFVKKIGTEQSPFRHGAEDRGRTGTGITTHGILSPGRLPIPPLRHEPRKPRLK